MSIPVNWDYSIPYGLLYSKQADEDVLHFVEMAEKYIQKKLEVERD